ncbi:hypothetical protein N7523_006096 [Penicillium sp. IBT 18751x]|nr:hypothetical protein N7523_006096 [Penicillium sp. IBT 18751x]
MSRLLQPFQHVRRFASSASSVPSVAPGSNASTRSADRDFELARQWLKSLNSRTIPRHLGQISFSRSSGPGGQNVNKVNSKATLKLSLDALLPQIPFVLHAPLRASRYAVSQGQALLIQSDESRKQASNVDSCFDKLHQLLRSTAEAVIPGETSPEQQKRVRDLQRAQNEARLQGKKFQSKKKSDRRSSRSDYD